MSRPENEEWILSTTTYGGRQGEEPEHFISSIQKGNVTACQFHPEKSGKVMTATYVLYRMPYCCVPCCIFSCIP